MGTLWNLFAAFLQIGAFSFGGGYAAMPLIQEQVVSRYHWLSVRDFMDLVTISQMTPGPIAINAATFVGHQVAGIPGSLAATIGVVLPSCIFVTILAYMYTRYRRMTIMQGVLRTLRPAVVSMIFSAGLIIFIPSLFENGKATSTGRGFQPGAFFLFLLALVLLRQRKWKKVGPITVMLLCGVIQTAFEIARSIFL